MSETSSPYWTGSKHGTRYLNHEGEIVRDAHDEDGRQLLIDHVRTTLGLTQTQAEHLADYPEAYA